MGRHGQLIPKRFTGKNVFGIFYKSGAPRSHSATTSCVLNGARATIRGRDDVTGCQIGTGFQEGLISSTCRAMTAKWYDFDVF